jgi:uncharacterized membrane protein YozB (DUF420 family)
MHSPAIHRCTGSAASIHLLVCVYICIYVGPWTGLPEEYLLSSPFNPVYFIVLVSCICLILSLIFVPHIASVLSSITEDSKRTKGRLDLVQLPLNNMRV